LTTKGDRDKIEFGAPVPDVTDQRLARATLAGERRVLEMMARGDSRALVFDALCRLVEELASGSLSSILLLEQGTNRLRHGAAPSLPAPYSEAIDGIVIGPSVGSCGTAAYRATPVIVCDIATDPLWADFRALALAHELRACWSSPILSSEGRVLGTFAIYYREPRSPTEQERNLIDQITHLASIAIERARAEELVRDSERRYRYIFESAGASIWEEDFSQVKAAIDELKAGGVRDFRQYFAAHPEFVERAIAMVRILDVNDATVRLFAAQDKQELLVSLDRVFTPETRDVFTGELTALAEGATGFESQTSLRTLKGDPLSVVFTIAFPAEPAELNSVLVTVTDVTEQKRAEDALRQARADIAHVSRVTTLGEMAASITHEVDQPLSGVVINANACLRFLAGPSPNLDEARDGLHAIARDGRRASEVTARIRSLARRAPAEKERLDVNAVILEVVALADGDARRARARVRTELAGQLPRVLGDRGQLQQIVFNLLLNGLEAMSAVVDRQRELVISTHAETADRVHVAVRDTGIGIDPLQAHRMFEAFYTTKRGGMGMGLSISRTIIEQQGGRLWAVPNKGPGATFHFTV